MDDDEFEQSLTSLGLSSKAATLYRELLDVGEATISELASETDVSRGYAYDVAESLEESGLAVLNDYSRPTTVRAHPPDEAVTGFMETIETVRAEIHRRYTEDERTRPIEVVKSKATLVKRIRELLEEATHEAMLAIPASLLEEIRPTLRATVDRDVLVLLLLTDFYPSFHDISQRDLAGIASVVRATPDQTPIIVGLRDDQVLTAPPEMLYSDDNEYVAVVHSAQYLVSHLPSFLEDYWSLGEEMYVTEPTDLPVTYTFPDLRNAILQATLHLEAGTDLWMEGQVAPADGSERYTEVNGRVTGTRQRLVNTDNREPFMHLEVETSDGEIRLGGYGGESTHIPDTFTLRRGGED